MLGISVPNKEFATFEDENCQLVLGEAVFRNTKETRWFD
jgi:hypothetical protein